MKKTVLLVCIGLLMFYSSFAITSKTIRDDCPQCAASMIQDGKRCILSGCIQGYMLCFYTCGDLQVPENN